MKERSIIYAPFESIKVRHLYRCQRRDSMCLRLILRARPGGQRWTSVRAKQTTTDTVTIGGVSVTDPAGGRDKPSVKMVESFEHRLMFGEDKRELNHPSTALRR